MVSIEKARNELLKGNNKSLGDIYLKCKPYCKNYLRKKYSISDEEFSDFYTDAALVLRQNIINGKVKSFDSINSYLLTICLNLKKKQFSEISRAQKKSEEIRLLYYDNEDKEIEKGVFKQNAKKAQDALKRLSEKCQQILTAFYVHDLSMNEIADELEFSSSDVAKTSKMRCHKKWVEYYNLRS
jgi:RNA polymerase sigma factor (sigma-70 family)